MKQDQRRISKEKHEIAYCRKLAREILKDNYTWQNAERVAKALLKFTRGYSKWK